MWTRTCKHRRGHDHGHRHRHGQGYGQGHRHGHGYGQGHRHGHDMGMGIDMDIDIYEPNSTVVD